MDIELFKEIWVKLIEVSVVLLMGMVLYRYSILYKIRENKQIKKQALTDPLTGKGNRHKFLADMDEHLAKEKKFAVCFMDLDGFKHVNDTLGHDAGDLLLIELSNMLEKGLPSNAKSYRLGGDEFSIIMLNIKTIEEISSILDHLKECLKQPVIIDNTKITLEYSLGVAIYPTDGTNRNDLMTCADDAMYYIKEHGKNSYYFHNEALKAKLDNKKKMESDLKEALKNNEFDVEYQPRVNLNQLEEMNLEVLLYWNHPVLGKLGSEYFIKQAEEMGIVIYLDEFVVQKACEKLREVKEKGYDNVKISINLSNMRAKRHDFVNRLCEILEKYSDVTSALQMEFTSKINIKHFDSYLFLMNRLKEYNVSICISNLELNYNTMQIFKKFPIDEIKINARYVSQKEEFSAQIMKDIVTVAKDLTYKVTIICIENEEELRLSIHAKADKLQGNYLFKSIHNENLEEYMQNYGNFKKSLETIVLNVKSKGANHG